MCTDCLREAGLAAPIDNEQTRAVAVLVQHLYRDFEACGGALGAALHIVTDDYNVEDSHLDFCEVAIGQYWSDHTCAQRDALQVLERAILAGLRPLSEQERLSAIELGHRRT